MRRGEDSRPPRPILLDLGLLLQHLRSLRLCNTAHDFHLVAREGGEAVAKLLRSTESQPRGADTGARPNQPSRHGPHSRGLRFGLRTLFALVGLAAIGLALVTVPAERQRRSVAAIKTLGGQIAYEDDDERTGRPSDPSWLRRTIGDDYFSSVVMVNLMDRHVTDAGLAPLKGLTGLQRLNLNRTPIGDAEIEVLKGLKGLRVLYLEGTGVTDAGLESLSSLTELRWLSLSNTKVYDARFKGMAALQRLNLNHTRISDAAIPNLKTLSGLRMLSLHDTQVTDAGLLELRAALPACEVYPQTIDSRPRSGDQ